MNSKPKPGNPQTYSGKINLISLGNPHKENIVFILNLKPTILFKTNENLKNEGTNNINQCE